MSLESIIPEIEYPDQVKIDTFTISSTPLSGSFWPLLWANDKSIQIDSIHVQTNAATAMTVTFYIHDDGEETPSSGGLTVGAHTVAFTPHKWEEVTLAHNVVPEGDSLYAVTSGTGSNSNLTIRVRWRTKR